MIKIVAVPLIELDTAWYIFQRATNHIVTASDLVTASQESISKMGAEKASNPSHKNSH
jgi:hypothetical protein